MVRTKRAAMCGFALVFAASEAQAQKLEYDCDTQVEHYSELKTVQNGPSYEASANITLREIFAVKKYVTMGVFNFAAQDQSWRARLGITALRAGKTPVLMGTLEITRNGKAEEPQLLGDILEYQQGKAYPIKLTLGANGGSATLGSHTVPVALQASGKVDVAVLCSGGEFLFTDLSLGN